MKKILEIAPYGYIPYSSGGQKSIALYLQYLGNEIGLTVISVPGNKFSSQPSYDLKPFLKRSSLRYIDLSLISKIISVIKKEGIENAVWEHSYFGWLAWFIKKRTGIKTILHTHNIEYQRFRSTGKWWWPVLKKYEKWFAGFADYVFFKTEEDRDAAVLHWKIKKEKCFIVPFGIEAKEHPSDRNECKSQLGILHGIPENEKILLYNGLLSYKPNLDALVTILDRINPLLLSEKDFHYKIIICGKGLPQELKELKDYADKNIIYAGFVPDIDIYFKGSDIFLNPVQTGGGIKTKMVEAIGFGTTVIATESGAVGINREVCENKLIVVTDNDWNAFASGIIENSSVQTATPGSYYNTYSWENIVRKVAELLG